VPNKLSSRFVFPATTSSTYPLAEEGGGAELHPTTAKTTALTQPIKLFFILNLKVFGLPGALLLGLIQQL
jgi:hypothetical protein